MDAPTHVTRSRRGDLAIFLAVLGLMLLLAPRLRVYYGVTVVEVTLEQVSPDGRRAALATPAEFQRPGNGYWGGESLPHRLAPLIERYMQASPLAIEAPPGTRFEWKIRWSDNSTKLDRVDHVVWEAPNAGN